MTDIPRENPHTVMISDLTRHFEHKLRTAINDTADRFIECGLPGSVWASSVAAVLGVALADLLNRTTTVTPEEMGHMIARTASMMNGDGGDAH